jgi:hypothetical protein
MGLPKPEERLFGAFGNHNRLDRLVRNRETSWA